jgi:hypothetical protein
VKRDILRHHPECNKAVHNIAAKIYGRVPLETEALLQLSKSIWGNLSLRLGLNIDELEGILAGRLEFIVIRKEDQCSSPLPSEEKKLTLKSIASLSNQMLTTLESIGTFTIDQISTLSPSLTKKRRQSVTSASKPGTINPGSPTTTRMTITTPEETHIG